jgi:hypothetical protein
MKKHCLSMKNPAARLLTMLNISIISLIIVLLGFM